MKLSMKWLKDFVDIDVSDKEFSDAMTMSGSKVEEFHKEGDEIKKVVVGEVKSIKKHENADKLFVCEVNIGNDKCLQIVTGAKNLKEGDKVPVALDGSLIFGGKRIKKGKLRGILSEGMLCSLSELGLTLNDFPNAVEDGIFVLEEECELGQDIQSAIGLNDTTFDFEITSNRPDCFSVIGLAREAAATLKKELSIKVPSVGDTTDDIHNYLTLKVEAEDLCPFYSARVVKNVKISSSPRWMRERLRAMGVRPRNNIVDITNYVMLEYGQPMHAFDIRAINGNEIVVRKANKGEKIVVIDGEEKVLSDLDLVIADKEKPLGIAGVMGGKHSSISCDTTTIVFESANFNATSIRLSAQRHSLRTESSTRYEKGLDFNICSKAIDRACELVNTLNAGDVVGGIITNGTPHDKATMIELDCDFINSFLSLNLSKEEMISILKRIGCKVEHENVIIPSYRPDLECKADIAEEIARFYGYNKIKSLPLKTIGQGGYGERKKFEYKVMSVMTSLGANQIVTSSFMDPSSLDKIRVSDSSKLKDYIKIRNPLGITTSAVRTTLLPSMLDALSRNYNNKNNNVCLFEVSKEFEKISQEVLPNEKSKLIIGMYGENLNFFDLKGILESFMDKLCLYNYNVESTEEERSYHSGRCANILKDGKKVGIMGELHPKILEEYEFRCRVYVAEIDLDVLFEMIDDVKIYHELPKYPSVERDLCVLCGSKVPVAWIKELILNASGNLLEEINLFDVYSGNQIERDKKSVAFNITFRSKDSTLTEQEVSNIMKKIVNNLEQKGVMLRK